MDHPLQAKPAVVALDPLVADILIRYEERQAQGQAVTAVDLCAACPELLPEVERHVRALRGLDPFLRTTIGAVGAAGDNTPFAGTHAGAALPPVFGRYRILKRLGEGGMGVVFLAHDTKLDRRVALKVPHFWASPPAGVLERFHREARAAATLHHPSICAVYDVAEHNGIHFLSMAYVEGQPLSARVRGDGWSEAQAASLVRKIALAMAEAHRHGIVHRDLKPSNIMIDGRGEPVVMDFGLARRALSDDGRLTQTGVAVGTPAYMPPEQVRGNQDAVGSRSDVYSLGVILYELLAGKLPYRGQGLAILSQVLTIAAVPLAQVRPGVDPQLAAICGKAMAREVEDRFADMDALAIALDDYLRNVDTAARTVVPQAALPAAPRLGEVAAAPTGTSGRRRWAAVALLAGVALACLGVMAIGLGVVLYISTARGTLKIEIDDPQATVRVNGDVITIDKLGEPVTLWAGKNQLTVQRGDLTVKTVDFVLRRGENRVLHIELLAKGAPPPAPAPAPAGEAVGRREKVAARLARARKLFFEDQRTEEAIAACTDALDADPENLDALALRATAYTAFGQRDKALADYNRAIRLDPENAQLYVNRSFVKLNLQKPDLLGTIADGNQALALANIDRAGAAAAHANRGWALAFLGHDELARADQDEAVRLDPIAVYYWSRAEVLERLGDHAAAKADIARLPRGYAGTKLPPRPVLPDDKPGTELRCFRAGPVGQQVDGVALAPSGRFALSGDWHGNLILWDVVSGGEIYRFPKQDEIVHAVDISPDGRLALSVRGGIQSAGAGKDFTVAVWDVARRSLRRRLTGHTAPLTGARFSPNGKQILSASRDGTVRLWDVASGEIVHQFAGTPSVFSVAFAPDGKRALVAGGIDKFMHRLDLDTGKEIDVFGHDRFVRAVAFSPNGRQALCGCWDKTATLWDLAGKKKLKTFAKHESIVNAVAFANGGRCAIVATGGKEVGDNARAGGASAIFVYDIATGAPVHVLRGHTWDVVSLAVSRDERYLLSGSVDGTVRLWQLSAPPANAE